jgi:mono/diheme cytochrome c family protein
VLFRLNCARCHTKGWSYYDPSRVDLPALPPSGSGAYGPNLTDGSELRQFPGDAGETNQYNWIAVGVPRDNQYGVRGISSGRMPHFMNILTKEQIQAIVDYERGL